MTYSRPILLTLMVVVAVSLQLFYFNLTIDDAYITYRYSSHLARGEGLVFNAGEKVEGYSNFLWVVLLAAFVALGSNPILAAKIMGAIFSLLTLACTYRFCRHLTADLPGDESPLLTIAVLVTTWYFNAWAVGGLETMFYCFLLILSVAAFARESDLALTHPSFPYSAVCYALLSMTRPEGAMFVAPAALFLFVQALSRRRSFRRMFIWGAVYAGIFGTYLSWRLAYYGMLLPNTYYAKTGGGVEQFERGTAYLTGFFSTGSPVWTVIFVIGVAGFIYRYRSLFMAHFVWVNLALQLLFCLFVGGDWMPGYRFILPVLPLLALATAAGWWFLAYSAAQRLNFQARSRTATAISAGVLLLMQVTVNLPEFQAIQPLNQNWRDRMVPEEHGPYFEAAAFLDKNSTPGQVLAIGDIGIVSYYNQDLKIVDIFGLVDNHISRLPGFLHFKSDPDYILAKNPDWMMLQVYADENLGIRFAIRPIQDILNHRLFQDHYALVKQILRGQPPANDWGEYFFIYRKQASTGIATDYDFYAAFTEALQEHPDEPIENPWNAWIAKGDFTIGEERKKGLYAAATSSLTYHLNLPDRPVVRLQVGIGICEKAWDWGGDGVRFQVRILDGMTDSVIFNQHLNPAARKEDRRWMNYSIDLLSWAGKQVTIVFTTGNDPGGNSIGDWAVWAEPKLTSASP